MFFFFMSYLNIKTEVILKNLLQKIIERYEMRKVKKKGEKQKQITLFSNNQIIV